MTAPGTDRSGGTTEYLDGSRAIMGALAAGAAAGRTGTAWLMGGNIGALYFRNGSVVGAELEGSAWVATMLANAGRLTPQAWQDFAGGWSAGAPRAPAAIPDALGLTEPEWIALGREAVIEATFELLPPGRPEVVADMVFQPDGIPGWTGSGRPLAFDALHREMVRRQAVLDRLRAVLTPESTIVRMSAEGIGRVQVTAQQWRFLAAISDGATPRSVARELGASTFATTIVAVGLMRLGMVGRRDRSGTWRPLPEDFPRALFGGATGAVPGSPAARG